MPKPEKKTNVLTHSLQVKFGVVSESLRSHLNPKSELEFKMVVTVGLYDISSMYITLETTYVFMFFLFKN